jgi:hypothetical protein
MPIADRQREHFVQHGFATCTELAHPPAADSGQCSRVAVAAGVVAIWKVLS